MKFRGKSPSWLAACGAVLLWPVATWWLYTSPAERMALPDHVAITATDGVLATHQLMTVLVLGLLILALIGLAIVDGMRDDCSLED